MEIREITGKYESLSRLYSKADEVGTYIAQKIGLDFDEILDKRLDGYSLSHIIDGGHNRGTR